MRMKPKTSCLLGNRLTIRNTAWLVNNFTGIIMNGHNDLKCCDQLSVEWVAYKHSTWKFNKTLIHLSICQHYVKIKWCESRFEIQV